VTSFELMQQGGEGLTYFGARWADEIKLDEAVAVAIASSRKHRAATARFSVGRHVSTP
jgi:hypothetical protein